MRMPCLEGNLDENYGENQNEDKLSYALPISIALGDVFASYNFSLNNQTFSTHFEQEV